jgi:predicted TIM-barrel fold metal-dependent hydrolase
MMRRRFVDSHLHLWDTRRNPWYRFPQPGDDSFGLGLKKPFPERYLWADYQESTSSVDLVKWVHVTALTVPKDALAESAWVASIAPESELPHAFIGTVDSTWPLTEIEAALDHEMANPAYRGLRVLTGLDYASASADALLSMLSVRGLVYDAVASPGGIRAAATGLARHPTLTVVLEHAGWPRGTSLQHFAEWQAEMADFAALPNTFCKLSGMGMVVHRNDAAIFRRFFDECVRLFGAERCMFGSNFPIDLCYGSGQELFAVFEQIARDYSDADAANLFAHTAERAYRL